MSLYLQLKTLINKKFPDMTFCEKLDKLDGFWIKYQDIVKILETTKIPKIFNREYIRNGVKYYSADNLLQFLRLSENPHHSIDYSQGLGFPVVERPLLEIVRMFDKYGVRGEYNYNMSQCSNCKNFYIRYYYHCPIPLLIDINDRDITPIRENLHKMFEIQKCKSIVINTQKWDQLKSTILYNIEEHLIQMNALTFMERVLLDSEEIKDVVEELGTEIVGAYCREEEFPFALSQCLKKFRINESNEKYKEIYSLFETHQEQNESNTLLEGLESLDDLEFESDSDCDSEKAVEGSVNLSDDEEYDFDLQIQSNNNTMYVEGIDYISKNNDYYLNHPTLIKVAIRSGVRRAERYVDKSWELIKYITKYGKLAYESVMKTFNLTPIERKHMFTITDSVLDQNRLDELTKAYDKIEELESHIDINKTKKEIEQYLKAIKSGDTLVADERKEKKPTKLKLKTTNKNNGVEVLLNG